jgi:hypothetical protein
MHDVENKMIETSIKNNKEDKDKNIKFAVVKQ